MSENISYKTFNFQLYEFDIRFLPYDAPDIRLNPDAVIQLVIEDDLLFWPRRGFVLFQNGNEMFEKSYSRQAIKKLQGKIPAKDLETIGKDTYIFRNDGKDRISIKIRPVMNPNSRDTTITNPPDDAWMISFVANIYDKEDPMMMDTTSKMKKVYFWEEKYHAMVERNIQWSTATAKLNPNTTSQDMAQATDEQRKMHTGDAISDLLTNGMGYEIDAQAFDKGSSKIFHTAPVDSTVWDNIEYLLNNHVSSMPLKSGNRDMCFFTYDPVTDKFQLRPISTIFNKAGRSANQPKEYQIEHLFLDEIGQIGNDTMADKRWLAPFLKDYDPALDVKITKIRKYSFNDMAGVDSMKEMTTTATLVYDRRNKTFTRSVEDTQIDKLQLNLKNDYITPNFLGGRGGAYPMINLNTIKKENRKTNPVHVVIPSAEVVKGKGYGRMVKNSIFMNQCLFLELDGATIRKTCRFVGVDRLSDNNSSFDYKFCGQWFISYVKHNFYKNSYVNELVCVKPHTYEKLSMNEDI